ncbi:MAG: type II toxin-antitoxin system VapC family toxin [Candidatus Sulfotelmatobacter sp.]
MRRFVLDASVSLAWFLDEPVPDLARRVRSALENGARALVPSLWYLEVANGFAIGERRGLLNPSQSQRCLDDIQKPLADAIDSSANLVSGRLALSVARTFRLTAYDAAYLEMARQEQIPLATLDKALIAAAANVGVPLFR